jgi:hypothetical protein
MVATPPTELLEYCLITCAAVEDCKLTLSRYQREFPYVKFLMRNIRNTEGGAPQVHEALACGSIDIVRYVWARYVQTTRGFQCFQSEFRKTLEGDSVECLAFIISKGCPVYSRGVHARSRACLDYLLANCPQYIPDFNPTRTYWVTGLTLCAICCISATSGTAHRFCYALSTTYQQCSPSCMSTAAMSGAGCVPQLVMLETWKYSVRTSARIFLGSMYYKILLR